MDTSTPVLLVVVGVVAFFIYRSHKRRVNYESVCEVVQVLNGLADRHENGSKEQARYLATADALREAQASIIAKRILDPQQASDIQRQLLGAFAPHFLESIGVIQGTLRFNRMYSGISSLAGDFERLHSSKERW